MKQSDTSQPDVDPKPIVNVPTQPKTPEEPHPSIPQEDSEEVKETEVQPT